MIKQTKILNTSNKDKEQSKTEQKPKLIKTI